MKDPKEPKSDFPIVDAEIVRDDAYSAQRKQLKELLNLCLAKNEPLRVDKKVVLTQDEIYVVLQKIKHSLIFDQKERRALGDAGFDVEKLYPEL